jgi:sialate O-acetylesterase
LKLTYGQNVPYGDPLFDSVMFENGKAIVSFKFAEGGLRTKDGSNDVRGFEIAGADKVFYFAKAEIQGGKVVVTSDKVKDPVAVRYAWSDAPVNANLYGVAGFPAAPFRTDDWPAVTREAKFH